MRILIFATIVAAGTGCGVVQSATRAGMMPILRNGVVAFIAEPDLTVAESAIAANLKLIEGVALTYPDEPEPLEMAAMARANYAFGFIQDDLEAIRFGYPSDTLRSDALVIRAMTNYAVARDFAERALKLRNSDYAEAMQDTSIETIEMPGFVAALDTLTRDDASALFWLAFSMGGRLQVHLDPVAATQLPKIEKMADKVLELDESVFYELGPHMLAGVLHGFRAPALGGDSEKAAKHLDIAGKRGASLLPSVLKAQFVYAQTENATDFVSTLENVANANVLPAVAALEHLAKRKACRLLANTDRFFLEDPPTLPEGCDAVAHKYRLREPE